MLTLRGAPALSAFRLDKLAQKLTSIHPDIRLRQTRYVHFAQLEGELAGPEVQVLERLLQYGPEAPGQGDAVIDDADSLLVAPRPGTISPWSSKATDIAHNCGLQAIKRLERGIAYYLDGVGQLDAGQRRLAIRMPRSGSSNPRRSP